MSDSSPPEITGSAEVSPADLRWEKKAEELQFEALTNVRGAAEKWSASLAAVLGLATTVLLVKGREDITELTSDFQLAVALILLAALISATAATVLAAYAAQGTPKELRWPSGARLREWERESALKAKDRLRSSRALALLTVALFAAAIAMTWFGEDAATSGTTVLLTPQDGVPVCGKLARGGDGELILKAGESSSELPLGTYTTALTVDNCPSP